MAIVRVKSTGKANVNATAIPMSFGTLPSAGNFIGVMVWGYDSMAGLDWTATACADNQSNTYTRAVQSAAMAGNKLRCALYYCTNIGSPSGTFTVTVTPNNGGAGNHYLVGVATEWSGIATTTPLDQIGTTTGNSIDPSTGATPATTQADELLLGVCGIDAALTSLVVDVYSPVAVEEAEELTFTYEPGEAVSRIVSSTGAQQIDWTASTGQDWVGAIATFKMATAAAPLNLTITDGVPQTTPF